MTFEADGMRPESPPPPRPSYEPPRVERVLTTAELAHEVMYAGPAVTQRDDV